MNSFFNKVSAEKRPVDVIFNDIAPSQQSKRVCFALDLRNVDSDAARLLGTSKYVSRNGVIFFFFSGISGILYIFKKWRFSSSFHRYHRNIMCFKKWRFSKDFLHSSQKWRYFSSGWMQYFSRNGVKQGKEKFEMV